MTEVFHISTTRHEEWSGPKRYIRIYVYDTQPDLLKSVNEYRDNDPVAMNTVGVYSAPLYRERYDKKIKDWVNLTDKHWGGLIRLCRSHILTEVVVHECVHAAAGIYRLDIAPTVNLGTSCEKAEEYLAYLVGDLSACIATELYERKIWRTDE